MKRITASLLLGAALVLPLSLISVPSASAGVSIGISVNYGPPLLPWYPQPICPGYGYYWVPGYWAYGPYGYFWVPGAWVWPPTVGYLWTPGWWGWSGGRYWWHRGYWGRHVGFYGGIAYGHGYDGRGYNGGRWDNGRFRYNRAVTRVKPSMLHDTYNRPINAPAHKGRRVSYNGGKGGVNLLPTSAQRRMKNDNRLAPTHMQTLHLADARLKPNLRLANNKGRPVLNRNGRTEHPETPRALRPDLSRINGGKTAPTTATHKPRGPVAVRTAGPPVLNAGPQPIRHPQSKPTITRQLRPTSPPRQAPKAPVLNSRPQPVQQPQRHPVITRQLRPTSPPRHAPKVPVLNAHPQPVHHLQPRPTIKRRLRPTSPPQRSVRPHRSIQPVHRSRPAPRRSRPAPKVHRHIAPQHHSPKHGGGNHRSPK
ncbi:MAG: hypothetical protein ACRES9_08015 [Gammaproteobacteria bacterium]